MRRHSTPNPWFLAFVGFTTLTSWIGCGGDEFTAGEPEPGTGGTGASVTGGAAGSAGNTGGHAGASGQGGANKGGSAGATPSGGAAGEAGSSAGGSSGEGGASAGGSSGEGGASTGGSSGEGGASTGGSSGEGGASAGGSSGEGGSGTGGQAGMGGSLPDAGGCGEGEALCGGFCINVVSNPSNCGACNHVCSYPHAQAVCSGGICSMGACETGWDDCDPNLAGCETDLNNDETNCGACGTKCEYVNGTSTCVDGLCDGSCTSPYLNCDANTKTGCETNGSTNPLHCGSCLRACSTSHADALFCESGVCGQSCAIGWLDCGDTSTGDDGCETAESDSSCGACAKACAAGTTCKGSICLCDTTKPLLSCGPGSCETDGTCSCPTFNLTKQCNPGERCMGIQGIGGSSGADGAGGSGGNEYAYEMMGAAGIGGFGGSGGGLPDTGYCACLSNTDGKGSACTAGMACCTTGCQDLKTDEQNCGRCGHRCAPGFVCATSNGVVGCVCDGDPDCNAGSLGTCTMNACICGNTTCVAGKRCLSNGTCG